jgi:hypothetical protein
MAQTANAMTFKDCTVAYTTDGSTTWTDCSGFANSIAVTGGERASGEAYTFDGDTAILGKGKRAPLTVTMVAIYTEESTTAPYVALLPYYLAGTAVGLKWVPKGVSGLATNEWVYTTLYSNSVFKNLAYPAGAANSADPVAVEMVLLTASIATSTQA